MKKQKRYARNFREIFSIDNVLKRFQALGFKPYRGSYSPVTLPNDRSEDGAKEGTSIALEEAKRSGVRPNACLLGSLEHAMFGGNDWGYLLEKSNKINLHPAVLHALEVGWEQGGLEGNSFRDNDETIPTLQKLATKKGNASLQEDIVAAHEWGHALGRIFVDRELKGVDVRVVTAVEKLHMKPITSVTNDV